MVPTEFVHPAIVEAQCVGFVLATTHSEAMIPTALIICESVLHVDLLLPQWIQTSRRRPGVLSATSGQLMMQVRF
jgi:hypothetical protein